jgi:hypothetical protein
VEYERAAAAIPILPRPKKEHAEPFSCQSKIFISNIYMEGVAFAYNQDIRACHGPGFSIESWRYIAVFGVRSH